MLIVFTLNVCLCVCVMMRFSRLPFCATQKIQIQYLTVRIPDAMKAKEKITNRNLNQKKMATAATASIIKTRNEIGMTLEWQGNVIFTRGNFRANE